MLILILNVMMYSNLSTNISYQNAPDLPQVLWVLKIKQDAQKLPDLLEQLRQGLWELLQQALLVWHTIYYLAFHKTHMFMFKVKLFLSNNKKFTFEMKYMYLKIFFLWAIQQNTTILNFYVNFMQMLQIILLIQFIIFVFIGVS